MILSDYGSDTKAAKELISQTQRQPVDPRGVIPCRIRVMPDDLTFRLDGKTPALSFLVRDRDNLVVDCVAWLEGQPSKWWLRKGDEMPILGARQLAGAEWLGFPLQIYPTPADWVTDGGNGVAVLSWGVNLIDLFDGLTLDVSHLPLATARTLAGMLSDNFRANEPKIIGLGGSDE